MTMQLFPSKVRRARLRISRAGNLFFPTRSIYPPAYQARRSRSVAKINRLSSPRVTFQTLNKADVCSGTCKETESENGVETPNKLIRARDRFDKELPIPLLTPRRIEKSGIHREDIAGFYIK